MNLDLESAMLLQEDSTKIDYFIKQNNNEGVTSIEYFINHSEKILTYFNLKKESYNGFLLAHICNFLFKKDLFSTFCSEYEKTEQTNSFFKGHSLYDKFSGFLYNWKHKEGFIYFTLLFDNDYKNSRYKTKLILEYNFSQNLISFKPSIETIPYTTLLLNYSEDPDEKQYSDGISAQIKKATEKEAEGISEVLFQQYEKSYIVNIENLKSIVNLILKLSEDKFVINEISRIMLSSGRDKKTYYIDKIKNNYNDYKTSYSYDPQENKTYIESFNSLYNLSFNKDFNQWLKNHNIQDKFLTVDNKEFVIIQFRPEFLSLSEKNSRNYFLFKDDNTIDGNYLLLNEDDIILGSFSLQSKTENLFTNINNIIGLEFMEFFKNHPIWIKDYYNYINSFNKVISPFSSNIALNPKDIQFIEFEKMINDILPVYFTLNKSIVYEEDLDIENVDFKELIVKIENNIISNNVSIENQNHIRNKKRI